MSLSFGVLAVWYIASYATNLYKNCLWINAINFSKIVHVTIGRWGGTINSKDLGFCILPFPTFFHSYQYHCNTEVFQCYTKGTGKNRRMYIISNLIERAMLTGECVDRVNHTMLHSKFN